MKKNTLSYGLLSLLIAGILLIPLEVFVRAHFPKDKIFTHYHRSWELEWKLLQFEKWRKTSSASAKKILLLGNSKMNSGVVPKILDPLLTKALGRKVSSFNLGTDGMTLREMRQVLLPALLDGTLPHQVLLEISPVTFWKRDVAESPYLKTPAAKKWSLESWLIKHIHTFAVRRTLRSWIRHGKWQPRGAPNQVSALGYKAAYPDFQNKELQGIQRFFEGDSIESEGVPARPEETYFSDSEFEILDDFIATLKKAGVDVKLILMPEVFYPYAYRLRERDLFFSKIEDLENKVPILNFHNLEEMRKADYYFDTHHLSVKGAKVFTSLLAKKMSGAEYR